MSNFDVITAPPLVLANPGINHEGTETRRKRQKSSKSLNGILRDSVPPWLIPRICLLLIFVDQPVKFVQLVAGHPLVLQQVGDQAAHVATEHTVEQLARGGPLDPVFLQPWEETKVRSSASWLTAPLASSCLRSVCTVL